MPINLPEDFARQPENGGVETLTVLPDGRVVAISEEYSLTPGLLVGWIGQPGAEGRYSWQSFQYAKTPDFNPTALAPLPDGGFVMLERAFDMARGVRIRVMRFEAAELQPGGTIHARELARLASPVAVDNLEGIAATKGAARRDAAVADLGRQLQSAPAQPAAAVRAEKGLRSRGGRSRL